MLVGNAEEVKLYISTILTWEAVKWLNFVPPHFRNGPMKFFSLLALCTLCILQYIYVVIIRQIVFSPFRLTDFSSVFVIRLENESELNSENRKTTLFLTDRPMTRDGVSLLAECENIRWSYFFSFSLKKKKNSLTNLALERISAFTKYTRFTRGQKLTWRH